MHRGRPTSAPKRDGRVNERVVIDRQATRPSETCASARAFLVSRLTSMPTGDEQRAEFEIALRQCLRRRSGCRAPARGAHATDAVPNHLCTSGCAALPM